MFNDKKKPQEVTAVANQQNRITEGSSIKGDIVSDTNIRIDGSILGNITTSKKVVIGEKGKVDGILESENADIEGRFTGKITINETLTIKSTAIIEGEVIAGKLAIEPGASFNASCVMKKETVDSKK